MRRAIKCGLLCVVPLHEITIDLNEECFEESSSQEQDYIGIATSPSVVDSLTDGKGHDNVTELLKVRMFQGQLRCTFGVRDMWKWGRLIYYLLHPAK